MPTDAQGKRWGRRAVFVVVGLAVLSCVACGMIYALFGDQAPTETADRSAPAVDLEEATAAPTEFPTEAPTEIPTDIPTAAPTNTALPTPTEPLPTETAAPSVMEIVAVNRAGEYVDIRNGTGADVSLAGWRLFSELGAQDCALDGAGVLAAGATLRIFAETQPVEAGQFSCGFDAEIWNNEERDPAVLIDPAGVEVDRR